MKKILLIASLSVLTIFIAYLVFRSGDAGQTSVPKLAITNKNLSKEAEFELSRYRAFSEKVESLHAREKWLVERSASLKQGMHRIDVEILLGTPAQRRKSVLIFSPDPQMYQQIGYSFRMLQVTFDQDSVKEWSWYAPERL